MTARLARGAAAIAALLLLAPSPTRAGTGDDDGWRPLFDGSGLDGWTHVGAGRFVLDGKDLVTEGGMGLLWYTKESLGDCVIRVVYRTEKASDNSGVYVRVAGRPDDPWDAVHAGYEVQICDQADPFHRTGAIYSLAQAGESPAKVGEWNTLEITLDGEVVSVSVNGAAVNRFDPRDPTPPRTKYYEPERGPRPTAGAIGLQNHDASSRVRFREVSVRPLRAGAR